MSGFIEELVVFSGIMTSPKYLLISKMLITFVMAIGMILTPTYLFIYVRSDVPWIQTTQSSKLQFSLELFVSICIFYP